MSLEQDTFVCFDCETTGLEIAEDRVIEIAVAVFTFSEVLDSFETLVDPERSIPQESILIHHITEEMVAGKPKMKEILPGVLKLIGNHPIVGHGIEFDIAFVSREAKMASVPCTIENNSSFDTLRMARLYGQSPTNSLEMLRKHFNLPEEGAHRAMSDVIVNIEVFKKLCKGFKSKREITERLSRPIELKTMPLGKYKARPFKEIPIEYLRWAVKKDFDQDLIYSIRCELKRRKGRPSFEQMSNPFTNL